MVSLKYWAALGLAATLGMGCGATEESSDDTSTISGKISNDDGYSNALTLAGSGTVESAAQVKAFSVASDGKLEALAEATVSASGSYELVVPVDMKYVVIEAYDEGGDVVGSAMVEATGAADSNVSAPPVSSETSLEAQVWIEMMAQGINRDNTNPIDLRLRIDSKTAAALRAKEEEGESIETDIEAFAEAIASAQQAEVESYAAMGIETSQSKLFEAELSAAQKLNTTLDNESKTSAQAFEEFILEIDAAYEAEGVEEEERARAESNASFSFRASLNARISSDTTSEAVLDAALVRAAYLEARTTTFATNAALTGAGAAQATIDLAVDAGVALRTSVEAATSVELAANAFTDYSLALANDAEIDAGVLGSYFAVSAATEASAKAALAVAASASAALDVTLMASADAAFSSASKVDVEAFAESTVMAYETFYAALEADVATWSTVFGDADSDAGVTLLASAQVAFRLSQN